MSEDHKFGTIYSSAVITRFVPRVRASFVQSRFVANWNVRRRQKAGRNASDINFNIFSLALSHFCLPALDTRAAASRRANTSTLARVLVPACQRAPPVADRRRTPGGNTSRRIRFSQSRSSRVYPSDRRIYDDRLVTTTYRDSNFPYRVGAVQVARDSRFRVIAELEKVSPSLKSESCYIPYYTRAIVLCDCERRCVQIYSALSFCPSNSIYELITRSIRLIFFYFDLTVSPFHMKCISIHARLRHVARRRVIFYPLTRG